MKLHKKLHQQKFTAIQYAIFNFYVKVRDRPVELHNQHTWWESTHNFFPFGQIVKNLGDLFK